MTPDTHTKLKEIRKRREKVLNANTIEAYSAEDAAELIVGDVPFLLDLIDKQARALEILKKELCECCGQLRALLEKK